MRMIERIDDRTNGIMYSSGALAAFIISFLFFVLKYLNINLGVLVTNHLLVCFVILLFLSLIFSMTALVISIVSIYPIPFNVDKSKPKEKNGKKKDFTDDTQEGITFEKRIKIVNPNLREIENFWQNINIDDLLDFRKKGLYGQTVVTTKKLRWLRWALISLVSSISSLIIALLFLLISALL